jgi:hypothetical protein
MSIRKCGKKGTHRKGAWRKGEEQGKTIRKRGKKSTCGSRATATFTGKWTWAASSVDDLPEQVRAGKVKTRTMGEAVSKAIRPAGRRSRQGQRIEAREADPALRVQKGVDQEAPMLNRSQDRSQHQHQHQERPPQNQMPKQKACVVPPIAQRATSASAPTHSQTRLSRLSQETPSPPSPQEVCLSRTARSFK